LWNKENRDLQKAIQTLISPLDLIIDKALENEVLLILHLLEKREKMTDPLVTRNMVFCLDLEPVGANPQLA
jgi:hypothetical protein